MKKQVNKEITPLKIEFNRELENLQNGFLFTEHIHK